MEDFEYHNLIGRPAGRFVNIGSKINAGIRSVRQQIVPYAEAWQRSNAEALKSDAPLWVVLGDSMSQGIGATAYDKGWVGQLAQQFAAQGKPYRIINVSISGARTDDLLARQIPALETILASGIKPELITVLIGSNDMVRKKYREHLISNFSEMLHSLPAGTVVANLPGKHMVAVAVDGLLRESAKHHRVVLADMQALTSWLGKVAEDHFHPNEKGYADIAAVFAKAIQAK
jgi:lysophospholipase L1-like esterase